MGFNKDGNFYVAPDGNDLDAGTKAAPFASPQQGMDAMVAAVTGDDQEFKLIIGSGGYGGNSFLNNSISHLRTKYIIEADGYVEFNDSSGIGISVSGSVTRQAIAKIIGIRFRNYPTHMRLVSNGAFNFLDSSLEKCIFHGGIIEAVTQSTNNPQGWQIIECIGYGVVFKTHNKFINTTFKGACLIDTGTAGSGAGIFQAFISCHFDTITDIISTGSVKDFIFNNNRGLNTGGFTLGTEINSNNINTDPLFNNSSGDDVTLTSGSPNRNAGQGLSNIGARGFHNDFNATDGSSPLKTPGATHVNITDTGSGFTLTTGGSIGTILSANIDLGILRQLSLIEGFLAIDYPTDVVDTLKTDTKPNRMQYEMKWADTEGGLAAASLHLFEYGIKPQFDGTQGNGADAFDPSSGSFITARWIVLKLTIRDDGV